MKTYKPIMRSVLFSLLFLLSTAYAEGEKSVHARINKVVKKAESYLGTPHVWGGTSKKGIDCSGLMQVSFAAGNINLPRVSREQAKVGRLVKRKELRRGDLVFFKIKGSRISHTGLVTRRIGNDVEFIHTSSSRGVMKSRLNQAYWKSRFAHGRRVWRYKPSREEKPEVEAPVVAEKPRVQPKPKQPASVPQIMGEFPQGSTRDLRKKDLKRMSDRDLTLMSMEIYARNGYIFPTPKAQAHFEKFDWYQSISNKSLMRKKVRRRLSLIEKSNLKKIEKILKNR